jgi:hypothetical protein
MIGGRTNKRLLRKVKAKPQNLTRIRKARARRLKGVSKVNKTKIVLSVE